MSYMSWYQFIQVMNHVSVTQNAIFHMTRLWKNFLRIIYLNSSVNMKWVSWTNAGLCETFFLTIRGFEKEGILKALTPLFAVWLYVEWMFHVTQRFIFSLLQSVSKIDLVLELPATNKCFPPGNVWDISLP